MTSCNHGVVLTPNGGTHRPDPGLDQQRKIPNRCVCASIAYQTVVKDLFADQDAVQQVMQTDIHQQTCHADVDVCRQSTSDLSLMPDAVPESKEIYRDDGISGNGSSGFKLDAGTSGINVDAGDLHQVLIVMTLDR